jgi:hypothetical protein
VHMNMPYFTAFVQASVGAAAHLAQPVRKNPLDLVQIDNGDWSAGSDIGVGTLYIKHQSGSTEAGADGSDVAWSDTPPHANAKWLQIYTQPYGDKLQTDSRPTNSETIFYGVLASMTTNTTTFSCANNIRFSFLASAESNRIYTVKIHVDGDYTADSSEYTCVTNLRQLIASGGFVHLPALTNLTNGAVYGTCDISSWLIATNSSNFPLRLASIDNQQLDFEMAAQAGSTIIDTLEAKTNLIDAGSEWSPFMSFTNFVPPDAKDFDSGWQTLARDAELPLTNSDAMYFRFKRQWMSLE